MPRPIVPLTNTKIQTVKSKEKDYKLFDGGGLFLLVSKTGGKRWRLKYRFNNKENTLSLGLYPTVTLKEARDLREKNKKLLSQGIDPSEQKKQSKMSLSSTEQEQKNTFYNISQEWHSNYASEVSENYHGKLARALVNYVYPFVKDQPIQSITRLDIIEILKDLKKRDLQETAKRVYMLLNKIYKYAVTLEYTPHNIIADIEQKVILGKRDKKHYPTFTKEKDIKALLLSIDEYSGDYTTKMALKVLPYLFVRSFNIRHCEWSEIDFEKEEWVIPKEKMKTKVEFTLPLAPQVISILKEVYRFSGQDKYVFPSLRGKDNPMSDNTLVSAIRRMGFTKEEFVPHSFRSMFSTIAYENMNIEDGHNFSGEVIEALLAHKESNQVKAAYNRANYKESMKGLINWYALKLDKIKVQ